MNRYRVDLGRRGEDIAAAHLRTVGHRILDRNWRTRAGELDIVTEDGTQVVAVEVKTRSSTAAGHPFEAVDARKFDRLHCLGVAWCSQHRVSTRRLRIDLVGVLLPRRGRPRVEHLEGVR